jgi:hypothetical protein
MEDSTCNPMTAEAMAAADDVLRQSASLRQRARVLCADARELRKTAALLGGVSEPERAPAARELSPELERPAAAGVNRRQLP